MCLSKGEELGRRADERNLRARGVRGKYQKRQAGIMQDTGVGDWGKKPNAEGSGASEESVCSVKSLNITRFAVIQG